VSELVGSVCIGLADILTDGIACARLVHGDVAVPNEGYKTAYVSVLCFAVVTTVISMAYRFHNARAMRAHVLKLSEQQGGTAKSSAARRQAQQNEWELEQTHRTKIILSLALLSASVQGSMPAASCIYGPSSFGATLRRNSTQQSCAGVPMSILNGWLVFVNDEHDKMVRSLRR
jgi:hypothetical protein